MSTSGSPAVRIVPIGGLGEIGMNCLALEYEGEVLIIDCGVTFPQSDLGIDVFHPDFSYVDARKDRIRGVVLTHGHEDHIGALPYLLRRVDTPLWAPCHALNLATDRLIDRGYDMRRLRPTVIVPRKQYPIGPFVVEPVRVAHSITDACALIIQAGDRTIVHTGDFKFDPDPPDGEPTDMARLQQLGDAGVDLLLSDSTNIDAEGESGTERSVGHALERLVSQAKGRVIIGMFSSNVQRLRLAGEVARKTRRRLCLLGRSVNTHVRAAAKCGRLSWPSDLVVPSEMAASLPPASVLVISSGTQAEPLAALSRLGTRTHPAFVPSSTDILLLSSRIIPGNDPAVLRMIGNFIRQGVEVHTRFTDPDLHVSGHAHRLEQRRMLEMVRPRCFVPIHGTLHHLKRHADYAEQLGVEHITIAENGDIVELSDEGLRKVGFTPVGKIATFEGIEISDEILHQRETLGRTGIVVVTLMVDTRGKLLAAPFVSTRGVIDEAEDPDLLRATTADVTQALSTRPFTSERPTDQDIADVVERTVRRTLDGVSGRRPVAVVHVVRP